MHPSPFLGVHHLGIVASDSDSLVAYYRDSAGLSPWPAADQALPGGTFLAAPNAAIRILAGGQAPRRLPVAEAGITHWCIQSTQVVPLRDSLADGGATFHSPLVDLGTGYLYCYSRDAEHNVVELEQVARVLPDDATWMGHVNLACADLERQTAFYAGLFGTASTHSPLLQSNIRLDQIAGLDDVAVRMAWVHGHNVRIELSRYLRPTSAATSPQSSRRSAAAAGYAYLAFEVQDVDAALEHLQASGGHLHPGSGPLAPHSCKHAATVSDPEGNTLWLLCTEWLGNQQASTAHLAQPGIVSRVDAALAAQQGNR